MPCFLAAWKTGALFPLAVSSPPCGSRGILCLLLRGQSAWVGQRKRGHCAHHKIPLSRPERTTTAIDARQSEDRALDPRRRLQRPPPRVSRADGRACARRNRFVFENGFDHGLWDLTTTEVMLKKKSGRANTDLTSPRSCPFASHAAPLLPRALLARGGKGPCALFLGSEQSSRVSGLSPDASILQQGQDASSVRSSSAPWFFRRGDPHHNGMHEDLCPA